MKNNTGKYYKHFFTVFVVALVLFSIVGCTPHIETTLKPTPSNQITASKPVSSNATTFSPSATAKIDPWTDAVIKAELIVYGTITDKKYETITITSGNLIGKRANTIFTLSIEKVIKGDGSLKKAFIRVQGGVIDGEVFEIYLGQYYSVGDKELLCLDDKKDNVYNSISMVWEQTKDGSTSPNLQDCIGNTIKIMLDNHIPITLPHSEWPPIPATTTLPR